MCWKPWTCPSPIIRLEFTDTENLKIQNAHLVYFKVILAMVVSWGICAILTTIDVLASDPKAWGYAARTDVRADVLQKASWFRFPYPGKTDLLQYQDVILFESLKIDVNQISIRIFLTMFRPYTRHLSGVM